MPTALRDRGDGEARAATSYPIIQVCPPLLMSVREQAQPPMRLPSASRVVLTQGSQARGACPTRSPQTTSLLHTLLHPMGVQEAPTL